MGWVTRLRFAVPPAALLASAAVGRCAVAGDGAASDSASTSVATSVSALVTGAQQDHAMLAASTWADRGALSLRRAAELAAAAMMRPAANESAIVSGPAPTPLTEHPAASVAQSPPTNPPAQPAELHLKPIVLRPPVGAVGQPVELHLKPIVLRPPTGPVYQPVASTAAKPQATSPVVPAESHRASIPPKPTAVAAVDPSPAAAAQYFDLALDSPTTQPATDATTQASLARVDSVRPADTEPDEFPDATSPFDLKAPGYAGRSPIEPTRVPDKNYIAEPDRWRIGLPGDYQQNTAGSLSDPYHQNVFKGDYPIIGQDKFLVITLTSDTLVEARKLPTPSGVSTREGGSFRFFGNGRSVLVNEDAIVSVDFFQGDASYRPRDFDLRATVVANGNYLHASERGVVSPDPRQGEDRGDGHLAVQELFAEKKLADLSNNYDFLSVRAGIQSFNNDFRGFLFDDEEPGVRLFGNYDNNRLQFNLAWFNQLEKDTNSGLNTFQTRDQNVFLANVMRQDFIFPGYTAELSGAANIDHGTDLTYDTNGFLVRPEPIGAIAPKKLEAYYLGWAGDGHIGPINITHQFYQVFGRESFNPIADRATTIGAQFAALELSIDRDYVRYRASFAYSSGDHNPRDGRAGGFDSIFDDPNFAGGDFNFFTRQAIPLTGTGVNLVQRNSFIPDLRTSKEEGQANFVNPGLLLFNLGADFDVTPKLKVITNASYLRFDTSRPLEVALQDNKIGKDIGVDLSVGFEYRPLLNNNIIVNVGAAALVPGSGFSDIYSSQTLYSTFCSLTLTY